MIEQHPADVQSPHLSLAQPDHVDTLHVCAICTSQMNDIQKELQQLRSEEEQHSKDSSQYSNLERTYEGLLATVKQLEVSHLYLHTCF